MSAPSHVSHATSADGSQWRPGRAGARAQLVTRPVEPPVRASLLTFTSLALSLVAHLLVVGAAWLSPSSHEEPQGFNDRPMIVEIIETRRTSDAPQEVDAVAAPAASTSAGAVTATRADAPIARPGAAQVAVEATAPAAERASAGLARAASAEPSRPRQADQFARRAERVEPSRPVGVSTTAAPSLATDTGANDGAIAAAEAGTASRLASARPGPGLPPSRIAAARPALAERGWIGATAVSPVRAAAPVMADRAVGEKREPATASVEGVPAVGEIGAPARLENAEVAAVGGVPGSPVSSIEAAIVAMPVAGPAADAEAVSFGTTLEPARPASPETMTVMRSDPAASRIPPPRILRPGGVLRDRERLVLPLERIDPIPVEQVANRPAAQTVPESAIAAIREPSSQGFAPVAISGPQDGTVSAPGGATGETSTPPVSSPPRAAATDQAARGAVTIASANAASSESRASPVRTVDASTEQVIAEASRPARASRVEPTSAGTATSPRQLSTSRPDERTTSPSASRDTLTAATPEGNSPLASAAFDRPLEADPGDIERATTRGRGRAAETPALTIGRAATERDRAPSAPEAATLSGGSPVQASLSTAAQVPPSDARTSAVPAASASEDGVRSADAARAGSSPSTPLDTSDQPAAPAQPATVNLARRADGGVEPLAVAGTATTARPSPASRAIAGEAPAALASAAGPETLARGSAVTSRDAAAATFTSPAATTGTEAAGPRAPAAIARTNRSTEADGPATLSAPTGPPPSAITVATRADVAVEDELANLAEAVACARVSFVYDEDTGALRVEGHVPSDAERADLLADMQARSNAPTLDAADLLVVDERYCEIVALLEEGALAPLAQRPPSGGTRGERAQSGTARVAVGDTLEVNTRSPGFAAYVYIDYFTADGEVIHMRAHGEPDGSPLPAGTGLRIGGDTGASPRIGIRPTDGRELVLVVNASERLYPGDRPLIEDADAYVAMLDDALDRVAENDARITYQYYVLDIEEPNS